MAGRTTYRAGTRNYAELDETLAAVQADLVDKEESTGKGDDGRGDAILDGSPKPVPGDELCDTLFQARAEKSNEAPLAAQRAAESDIFGRAVSDETRAEALAGWSAEKDRNPPPPPPGGARQAPDYFDQAVSDETRREAEADWARRGMGSRTGERDSREI